MILPASSSLLSGWHHLFIFFPCRCVLLLLMNMNLYEYAKIKRGYAKIFFADPVHSALCHKGGICFSLLFHWIGLFQIFAVSARVRVRRYIASTAAGIVGFC